MNPIIERVIRWIKPSAEGKNQTASGRRLSAFGITVIYGLMRFIYVLTIIGICIYLVSKSGTTELQVHNDAVSAFRWQLFGLVLDVVFIGLLWGYINQQGIIEFKNGYNKKTTETKESVVVETEEKQIPN